MMDFSGLPDQEQPETGGDLLSGLPDTNAGTLRKQYRSTALAPDTAAKVVDLSAKSGLPRVTVERNQQFAERKANEPDWDALEVTAPVTARTLAANASMFEIAHDDTENLSNTEKVFGTLSRHVRGVAGSLSAGVLNDTNAAVWGWLEGGAKALGANKTGDYFKVQRKFQEGQAAGAQGGYSDAGFAEASVASGVRSLGTMAPGLLAAVMTGNPAFSLGMGSGQAGGQTVGKGLDAGVSPVQSLVYGAEDATAEWATEMLPMGLLIRDLKLGAPLYKILARQIATEVPTEIAATAWQNFNEWANVNPEMSFSGYLEKLGPDEALTISSTIVQTVLSAGLAKGTSKILQRATAQQDQADSAMKSADGLAQLAKLAAESKLRARDPKTFQAFVEAANEEGGVQDVYLDTNTLLQAGVDLDALAQLSPVVAEQLKQPNTGGDLVIPVGEYAARIAGSEVDTLLAPHLRVSEDALSSVEAQAFYQNQGEEFAKAAQQVMEEKANDTTWTDSAKVVETQLFDQLQQTGRFTADANTAYATLMRDFYVTTAGRLNLTPEEMFAKYPLQISGESKAGGKTMEALDPGQFFQRTAALQARAVSLDALAGEGNKQAVVAQTLINSGGLSTKKLGNVLKSVPEFSKLSSSERIPSLAPVLSAMRRAILDNPQVLDAVIAAAPVDMVNNLFGGELAAKSALHDEAMLKKSNAFDANLPVTEAPDTPASVGLLVREVALATAKTFGSTTDSRLKTTERNTTPATDKGGSFSQGKTSRRAEITFADDITSTPSLLSLLKTADLSSFLHEMGHFQLEVLSHIASQPNAPVEIVEDLNKILKWFAEDMTLEKWQAMSLEEKRPFHEQFARGFEAYLFEGKAPSVELNSVFARLRSWLINVYKSVVNLRVEISDDLRGVFDRLLATEDAIKQAEEMREYGALYTSAEQMGMDAEGWAEYQRTAAEATDEAMTTLQKRSLRDMQWLTNARNRTLKKLQQDAKAKRNAVQEEVTAEVQEMPLYAALRFIRQREGNSVTKLSLPELKEMYGEGPAAPWRYLPVGLAANEGLAPDRIAELFGFTSGDHLVRSILEQSSEKDMIEGMTDQRMLERYGDINSPDALSRAADEAIHNAARARFVATELKALDKSNTPARVIAQAAKAFAEATIARKKVREIRPSQHAAAELRAAKAAQKAMIKGDTRAAAIEKRNQLIQNLSTKEAYNALGEIDKAVRYLRKFDKEGPRKSIDVGYLDQIDQLLERFDFRASVTNKAAKKRESLLAWLEEQRLQGFEPDVPQELQTEALRKPYRELTMEELRGLIDTVKQIEHLGRLKRKLLTSKDAREFQEIRDEIAASIEEHAKKTVDLRTRSNTAEALKSGGKHFLAMHRKMASLARELDGFKDGGPMWEYFIRSMNTAGDLETTKRGEATARLFELVKPLLSGEKMGGKGRYFETLQGSFNREERIAIALNLGNAGNTQRLLDGEGWSMGQLRPLLDTITPEEAAFVQNIWDFFESYRPEIAAKERRVYGKEPNWVEPTPIALGGQQLRGGYYPIRYDANRTGKAEQFAAAEEAKAQMKGAFTSSTTRRSFTKTRAEEVVGRPLVYSFSGLYLGANEVIHDLAWHEWLIDANRLVRSLDGVIRLHYGSEGVAVFKKGIEDIAAGDAGAANAFEKGLNHIRTGATIAGLGWNLTTSLFQPLGLLPSMVRVGPGWMAKGIGQFLAHPKKASREITAKSAMMTDRAKTMQREINEIQNQIHASKLDPVRATFFVLIQKAQWIADAPTWLGAYEKATAEGNEEARAVALADQAVLDSQGGGQTKDLAQIQRGGPLLKLWTNFYSYFNTVYNLGAEKTNEKIGSPKLYPSLALDYLLLYIIPAALVTILRDALSGGDDDDLVKKLLADQISNVTGLLIGLRETTAGLQKVAGVEQYKGSYGGPAGLRLFQELDKLGQQVGQGEADEALFKAINNVGGIVFHYPSGQVARTVGGAAAMLEGKTENPASIVLGPPRK